ncbi:DUF1697 domain-containing protein [Stenotrophomonas maltophilia]|uniref:DUF1697 domain-containing protein n=1 Tax=Stenotrophomonas maltophilia TaxID=40324 RepID=UPI00130FC1A6|nr:hypothetical protein PGKDCPLP_01522 [Stenotrophomonas maltophilia]
MSVHVALLRAVNVGGTGKLPMVELVAMCEDAGFTDVRTYIASGNVVFRSGLDEAGVRKALGQRLQAYAGKPVGVLVRSAAEIAAVAAGNPFPHAAGNRVVALFVDEVLPADPLTGVTGLRDEQLALGTRELFVHYGDGMADSRLRIPYAQQGTARNLNTVGKLAAMAAALGQVTADGRGRR